MRKFSKILALVLAFAMVLCPVLTAAAEGEAEVLYSSAILNADIADGKADVTLTVETIEEINAIDFKINLAKGVSFDPEVDTVSINADESGDAASWSVVTNYADGVLSVLAVDGDDMANVAAYLVFNITLTVENSSDYDFYLTKIYAVGAGSADADEVIAVFPYADNAQSGVIDVEAARTDCPDYFVTNVCAHANVTTTETPATCTEPGSSVVTCDDCGSVISETELPATGHTFAVEGEIIAATEEAVGYYGYDIACSVCDALNPDYYAEDGSVRTDVDFASLAADGVIDEIPMLEVPCAPADVWSSDETGHWHDCTCGDKHDFAEHIAGDAVEVERVDAQPGVAGYYVTVVSCTECEYEISRTTTEIPALPVGPSVDEDIVFNGEKMQFSNTINALLRISKALVEEYASLEVIIEPTVYSAGNEVPGETIVIPVTSGTTKNWNVYYEGIGMYAMALEFDAYVKCYDAKGNYVAYSNVTTYTPVGLIKAVYTANPTTAAQRNLNALVTDTLNLATMAQKYFANQAQYAGSDLAADVAAGNVANKDWPQDYATTTYSELNTVNSIEYVAPFTSTNSKLTFLSDLNGAPVFTCKFSKYQTAFPDLSKLKLELSYTEVYGESSVVTDTIEGDEWQIAGKSVVAPASLVALYDGNKTVTGVLSYDGTEVIRFQYSLESYISENLGSSDANFVNLLNSIAYFNVSSRTYFGTK